MAVFQPAGPSGDLVSDPQILKAAIRRFAATSSLEISARDTPVLPALRRLLPRGATVSITWMAKDTHDDRVAAARALREAGFDPAPHIAARRLTGPAEYDALVARLAEVGVTRLFVIGGDVPRSTGEFDSALELLARCRPARHGILSIGVGAYPEGHPAVDQSILESQLDTKLAVIGDAGLRPYVVTQFAFDAMLIRAWLGAFRARGNEAPVRIGFAGPANVRTLLRFARFCGVTTTTRALARHGMRLGRALIEVAPDRPIAELAASSVLDDRSAVALHLFPFGGVERTARWVSAVAEGRIRLRTGQVGFDTISFEGH
jgi:methylenetetrahydrofolate reductase (NADPH)